MESVVTNMLSDCRLSLMQLLKDDNDGGSVEEMKRKILTSRDKLIQLSVVTNELSRAMTVATSITIDAVVMHHALLIQVSSDPQSAMSTIEKSILSKFDLIGEEIEKTLHGIRTVSPHLDIAVDAHGKEDGGQQVGHGEPACNSSSTARAAMTHQSTPNICTTQEHQSPKEGTRGIENMSMERPEHQELSPSREIGHRIFVGDDGPSSILDIDGPSSILDIDIGRFDTAQDHDGACHQSSNESHHPKLSSGKKESTPCVGAKPPEIIGKSIMQALQGESKHGEQPGPGGGQHVDASRVTLKRNFAYNDNLSKDQQEVGDAEVATKKARPISSSLQLQDAPGPELLSLPHASPAIVGEFRLNTSSGVSTVSRRKKKKKLRVLTAVFSKNAESGFVLVTEPRVVDGESVRARVIYKEIQKEPTSFIDQSSWGPSEELWPDIEIARRDRLRHPVVLTSDGRMMCSDLLGIICNLIDRFKELDKVSSLMQRTSNEWKGKKTGIVGRENVTYCDFIEDRTSQKMLASATSGSDNDIDT